MVQTRSSTASTASAAEAEKSRCFSAVRKSRRRRSLAMPERKKKLRRQKALQKQIAASQEVLVEYRSEINSNPKKPDFNPKPNSNPIPEPFCKKSRIQNPKSDLSESQTANRSQKTLRKRAAAAQVVIPGASNDEEVSMEDEGAKNPNSAQENRKSNSARGRRNPDILPHICCKTKVRVPIPTSDKNEACAVECSHDEVEALKHEKGWTIEQDLALQNAYFQVLPSPNFWFEVSKKVFGKTAKECFDRFYSAHPTPPVTQPRSRKSAAESSMRTISFLSPRSPSDSKPHFGRGKQGLFKAHQTVRHILRQQRVADGSYEADVFSTVEQINSRNPLLQDCTNCVASPSPSLKGKASHSESSVATPASCLGNGRRDNEELRRSVSSKLKAQFVQDQNQYITRTSVQGQLLSPEVLKMESNPGRLDRYLDMLHLRWVEKKKSLSVKGKSQGWCIRGNKLNPERRLTQSVSAAREAIITDAKEVLKTVLNQQSAVEEETSLLFDDVQEESSLMLED